MECGIPEGWIPSIFLVYLYLPRVYLFIPGLFDFYKNSGIAEVGDFNDFLKFKKYLSEEMTEKFCNYSGCQF